MVKWPHLLRRSHGCDGQIVTIPSNGFKGTNQCYLDHRLAMVCGMENVHCSRSWHVRIKHKFDGSKFK